MYEEDFDSIEQTSYSIRPTSSNSNRIKSVAFKKNKLELSYVSDDESQLLADKNSSGKLSLLSKLCFGVGGIPYQMCANSLALYIQAFLLEIAQIRPRQVSIILFSARGWDAICDPIVGFLVSRTKTRFGRFRPW
jgi:hypothetical protein